MSWWDEVKGIGGRLADPMGANDSGGPAPWWDPGGKLLEDPGAVAERQRKALLYGQAGAAGGFADQAQGSYGQLGAAATQQQDYLRQLASGQRSVSGEQLRQGLQQNQATQMSLAAGASPQNAAMAARTAAIQSGRLGAGLAGQQAVAGLQEQQAANNSLNNLIMQQRQQELQATLGSRQGAMQGYGAQDAGTPEKSNLGKYGGLIGGIVGGLAGGA